MTVLMISGSSILLLYYVIGAAYAVFTPLRWGRSFCEDKFAMFAFWPQAIASRRGKDPDRLSWLIPIIAILWVLTLFTGVYVVNDRMGIPMVTSNRYGDTLPR